MVKTEVFEGIQWLKVMFVIFILGGMWMVNQKHHLTNWGMVCKSKDSGGLGIPNLKYE